MSSKSLTITNQLNQLKSQAKMARKSRKLKCVFIGDSAVGKTSLIVSYTTNGYPTDYVPTAFDTYSVLVTIDNKPCQLQLYDTAGQDDFDSIRPLCYSNTDIFLVAFSVVSPRSFHNVRRKWLPEIRRTFAENNQYKGSNHSTIPPFIMIGTQCDLRHDVKVLIELNATSGEEPISSDYAKNMARKLGAICYIECSALTQKNLKEVFDSAILAGLEYQRNQQRSKHNHHHHPKHSPIGHHSVNQGPRPSKPSSSHKPSTANSADHQLTGSPYSPRFHGSTTAKQPMEEYDDILSGNSRNYHQKQHHYLPISTATATSATTVKLAQISDAKLVGWRKSLTKLSAEEALKQEAAAEIAESNNSTNTENNNYDNDHDQEDNYDYYYDYNPYYNPIDSLITTNDGNSRNNQPLQLPHQQQQLFTPNLSTFSPLLPARRSMKIANDSTESKGSSNHHPKSSKSSKSTKESGHKNESFTKLQMLNSATTTATAHHHHHHHKSPKGSPLLANRKILENDSSHGLKPLKNSKSNYMADYQPLPMACPTQNMLNNSPYALQTYSTPYGTTVAMIPAIIASPVIKHRVTNQVKPLPTTPNIPAAAPPIIHNCSVFHQLNTAATAGHKSKKCLPVLAMVAPSINDEKARQPQQQQPAAATVTINNHNCKHVKQPLQSQQPLQPQSQQNMKSSTTLRSSSFFFLPSKMTGRKMMNINHQDDSVEICKQKPRKKLSKSNSVTSNDDGSVVSTASFESSASCSSDCSSNELFHKSNLPPETHDSNSNPNKSMLDLFHRLMSTSVSELRNRKSMFRRLASTMSSSSRSATSSTFTNSDDHHHHPHRKLKNEKNILKNLYYIDCIDDIDHHNNYDDYDYEEIDFDRSSSKNNQRSSSGGDNGSSSKTCCGLGSGGSGGSSSSSLWTCCFSPNF